MAVAAWSGCIQPTDPIFGQGGGVNNPTGATGSLTITVTTTGPNQDPNGYQLLFTETVVHPIDANGTAMFTVAVGSYQVTLTDLAPNCTVADNATQGFSVAADAATTVEFAVTCA